MKVRICPLCDSEMTKKHHCDACNSWIWKAQTLDIHYDAQDRGKGEIDCAYGDAHDMYHHKNSYMDASASADDIQKMRDLKWRLQQKYVDKSHTSQKKESYTQSYSADRVSQRRRSDTVSKKKKNSKASIIVTIVLAVLGMNAAALVTAVHDVWDYAEEEIGSWIEPDRTPEIYDDADESPVEEYEGITYLSDDELVNYPNGCTGEKHFLVKGEDLVRDIESWLEIADVNEWERYDYDDNYIYAYEGNSEEIYLEHNVEYNIYDDNEYDRIIYSSDSITEQVHYISVSLYSEEKLKSLLPVIISAMDSSIDTAEINKYCEKIFEGMQDDGDVYNAGNMQIYAELEDDGELWIYIEPIESDAL